MVFILENKFFLCQKCIIIYLKTDSGFKRRHKLTSKSLKKLLIHSTLNPRLNSNCFQFIIMSICIQYTWQSIHFTIRGVPCHTVSRRPCRNPNHFGSFYLDVAAISVYNNGPRSVPCVNFCQIRSNFTSVHHENNNFGSQIH